MRWREVTKPRRKKRLPSLKTLKNKLDVAFSKHIRQRGMSEQECNICVSCGAVHSWKVLQCGHFYRRQHLGTRWDERNCWPQCFACNVWRRGNYASFAHFMYSTQPPEVMEELEALHKQTVKLTRSDLESLLARYTQ